MKILIPNVTGPTNMGDQYILDGLLNLFGSSFSNPKITIQTTDQQLYSRLGNEEVKKSLVQYIAIDSKNTFLRILRVLHLFFWLTLSSVGLNKLANFGSSKEFLEIVDSFKQSDLIVFVGGGYLRSKKGITQSVNLLLQLSVFWISKIYKKQVIVAPISFGPFAYTWQEIITGKTVSKMDFVCLREEISYRKVLHYKTKNIAIIPDTAFLSHPQNKNLRKSKNVLVGFNLRQWFEDKVKQDELERAYVFALLELYKNHPKVVLLPIIQVSTADFPKDSDVGAVQRVYERLKDAGVSVLQPTTIKNLAEAHETYEKISLLVAMRLHASILAAVHSVPFLAVSYEYKTEGILDLLGFKNVISCNVVTAEMLKNRVEELYEQRVTLTEKLRALTKKLQTESKSQWSSMVETIKMI
jgi:colanic acid/amylovoran biosynthesis protein